MRYATSRHHLALVLCGLVILLSGIVILTPGAAGATWIEAGNEISAAPNAQQSPTIIADGEGGAILTWHDTRSGAYDVYAQRVSGTGENLWTPNGVPVATAVGTQKFPAMTSDGAGGAILTWKDDRTGGFDIRAQRLSPDGVKLWGSEGVVVCGESGTQQDGEIVSDGAGGALLVWRDFRHAGVPQIYGQRLNASGQAVWPAGGIPVCTVRQQYSVSLVSDGANGAFVAFYDYRSGSNFDIYAQHLTGAGALAWGGAGVAVCSAPGDQMYPRLMGDWSGGLFIGWYDARSGGYDIYMQRLDAQGAVVVGWPGGGQAVCTAGNDQFEPVMTPDGQGGAFVAWYDNRSIVGVYASRFTGDGVRVAGWPANGLKVNISPSTRPAIFPGGEGGAVIAWHGTPGSTNLDVVATEVTTDGQVADGWPSDGLYLCTAPGDQTRPQGVSLGNGDVMLAWSDMRSDAGDIYVTRVAASLPNLCATQAGPGFDLPLVPRDRADAIPSQVHLTPELDGNQASTRLNWSVQLEGASPISSWGLRVDLDGSPLVEVVDMGPAAPGSIISLNQGPFQVAGGRHTLSLAADQLGQIPEATEGDNVWSRQFVWSPLALARDESRERPAPPTRGDFPEPNGDGFSFAPATGVAWGVAAVAAATGADVDLIVYDDYASSVDGFSHRIGESFVIGAEIDFVIGAGGAAPVVYPAVVASALALETSSGSFEIQATDASGRRGTTPIEQWTSQPMGGDDLLDVYEADLVAGQTYYLTLVRVVGSAPIAMALFPAGPGVWSRDDAVAVSDSPTHDGDGVEVLAFTPESTGRYPVAVHRSSSAGLNEALRYHFFWSNAVSGVGDEIVGGRATAFHGASPNPMSSTTRLHVEMREPARALVQVFDVHGRMIRTVHDGPMPAGRSEWPWDGRAESGESAPGGVYFVRLLVGDEGFTRRLTLLR